MMARPSCRAGVTFVEKGSCGVAGTGLLALLDDIATVLDDIAVMTKVAAKKTAGVLGDDLALNADQISGVRAERELPVVWAVAKGSLKNKLILVPVSLIISALASWAITPLLMAGGAYLCFEGFEKLVHKFLHRAAQDPLERTEKLLALSNPQIDLVTFEQGKIKGAIRTDFILSAEIIVIALGTVQGEAMGTQIAVVAGIALFMTIGVYALVAGIVKLDDAGLHLVKAGSANLWGRYRRFVGRSLLRLAPYLMKTLSIVGTAAMFLVGGGILMHGLPYAPVVLTAVLDSVREIAAVGGILVVVAPIIVNALAGVVAGGLVLAVVLLARKITSKFARQN
jgi:predicted DNA repair protein MutK